MVLAVYRGPGMRRLREVASNDDALGGQQRRVEFEARSGATYRIAVDRFAGAQGEIVLNHALMPVGAIAHDRFVDARPLKGRAGLTCFDTVLAVYRGSGIGQLREVASNDDVPALDRQSGIRFPAQAGVTYRIAVDGFGGAEGDITLIHSDVASLEAQQVAQAAAAAPGERPAANDDHAWRKLAAR